MDEQELREIARTIIEVNRYMTLATADEEGRPWVSPVWYAPTGYREFFWVSDPGARHSRNLAARPDVSIVIFDSNAPVGSGQGVYMTASAAELTDAEFDRGLGVFSRRSQQQGARTWAHEDVRPPARHRLYGALASEHFVLGASDERIPVTLR